MVDNSRIIETELRSEAEKSYLSVRSLQQIPLQPASLAGASWPTFWAAAVASCLSTLAASHMPSFKEKERKFDSITCTYLQQAALQHKAG